MDTVALYHHARQIEHLANAFRDFYIARTEQVSGHTDKDLHLAEAWWNQDRTLAKETRKWSRIRIALNALFMLILASVIVAFAAQLWKKTIRPSYTNVVFKNVSAGIQRTPIA